MPDQSVAPLEAIAGQIVLMPANVPHSARATERFEMLLVMLRSGNRPT